MVQDTCVTQILGKDHMKEGGRVKAKTIIMERRDAFLCNVGLAAARSTCSQMALKIASVAVCFLMEGSASSAGVLL